MSQAGETGFRRVALVYDPTEARLILAALEGAGIFALSPSLQIVDVNPVLSLAVEGIPIVVPAAQENEAVALLDAIAQTPPAFEDAPEEEAAPPQPASSLWRKILDVVMILFGVSRPLTGMTHSDPPQKPPRSKP